MSTKNVKLEAGLEAVRKANAVRAEITELYRQYHSLSQIAGLTAGIGFTQTILFAHCQETGTVITTWGTDAEQSSQSAAGANTTKKCWGWPEDTIVESAKVAALRDRIAELEAHMQQLIEDAIGEDL